MIIKTRKLPKIIKSRKTIKTMEVYLPAHWASFLINGDSSGLVDYHNESLDDINATLARYGVADKHCVNVSENIDLMNFDGLLTEVAEFTFFA